MKRFGLKNSQYEYELKRSIKKKKSIEDWLSEKYGVFLSVKDKTLFHFTKNYCLPTILEDGIILGDVMIDYTKGLNSPNLTSEGFFHDPASLGYERMGNKYDPSGYLRLVLKVKEGDERLVNYRWFDKKYCQGKNGRLTDKNKSEYGDLSRQYLFKGVIDPSMIVRIDGYDQDLKKFVTLSSDEIEKICKLYKGLSPTVPCQLRIGGFKVKDWTGGLENFYSKRDPSDCWSEVYKLSDYLVRNLKGLKKELYSRKVLLLSSLETGNYQVNEMVGFIVDTYNRTVSHNKRIHDLDKWGDDLREKVNEMGRQWDEVHKLLNEETVSDLLEFMNVG